MSEGQGWLISFMDSFDEAALAKIPKKNNIFKQPLESNADECMQSCVVAPHPLVRLATAGAHFFNIKWCSN